MDLKFITLLVFITSVLGRPTEENTKIPRQLQPFSSDLNQISNVHQASSISPYSSTLLEKLNWGQIQPVNDKISQEGVLPALADNQGQLVANEVKCESPSLLVFSKPGSVSLNGQKLNPIKNPPFHPAAEEYSGGTVISGDFGKIQVSQVLKIASPSETGLMTHTQHYRPGSNAEGLKKPSAIIVSTTSISGKSLHTVIVSKNHVTGDFTKTKYINGVSETATDTSHALEVTDVTANRRNAATSFNNNQKGTNTETLVNQVISSSFSNGQNQFVDVSSTNPTVDVATKNLKQFIANTETVDQQQEEEGVASDFNNFNKVNESFFAGSTSSSFANGQDSVTIVTASTLHEGESSSHVDKQEPVTIVIATNLNGESQLPSTRLPINNSFNMEEEAVTIIFANNTDGKPQKATTSFGNRQEAAALVTTIESGMTNTFGVQKSSTSASINLLLSNDKNSDITVSHMGEKPLSTGLIDEKSQINNKMTVNMVPETQEVDTFSNQQESIIANKTTQMDSQFSNDSVEQTTLQQFSTFPVTINEQTPVMVSYMKTDNLHHNNLTETPTSSTQNSPTTTLTENTNFGQINIQFGIRPTNPFAQIFSGGFAAGNNRQKPSINFNQFSGAVNPFGQLFPGFSNVSTSILNPISNQFSGNQINSTKGQHFSSSSSSMISTGSSQGQLIETHQSAASFSTDPNTGKVTQIEHHSSSVNKQGSNKPSIIVSSSSFNGQKPHTVVISSDPFIGELTEYNSDDAEKHDSVESDFSFSNITPIPADEDSLDEGVLNLTSLIDKQKFIPAISLSNAFEVASNVNNSVNDQEVATSFKPVLEADGLETSLPETITTTFAANATEKSDNGTDSLNFVEDETDLGLTVPSDSVLNITTNELFTTLPSITTQLDLEEEEEEEEELTPPVKSDFAASNITDISANQTLSFEQSPCDKHKPQSIMGVTMIATERTVNPVTESSTEEKLINPADGPDSLSSPTVNNLSPTLLPSTIDPYLEDDELGPPVKSDFAASNITDIPGEEKVVIENWYHVNNFDDDQTTSISTKNVVAEKTTPNQLESSVVTENPTKSVISYSNLTGSAADNHLQYNVTTTSVEEQLFVQGTTESSNFSNQQDVVMVLTTRKPTENLIGQVDSATTVGAIYNASEQATEIYANASDEIPLEKIFASTTSRFIKDNEIPTTTIGISAVNSDEGEDSVSEISIKGETSEDKDISSFSTKILNTYRETQEQVNSTVTEMNKSDFKNVSHATVTDSTDQYVSEENFEENSTATNSVLKETEQEAEYEVPQEIPAFNDSNNTDQIFDSKNEHLIEESHHEDAASAASSNQQIFVDFATNNSVLNKTITLNQSVVNSDERMGKSVERKVFGKEKRSSLVSVNEAEGEITITSTNPYIGGIVQTTYFFPNINLVDYLRKERKGIEETEKKDTAQEKVEVGQKEKENMDKEAKQKEAISANEEQRELKTEEKEEIKLKKEKEQNKETLKREEVRKLETEEKAKSEIKEEKEENIKMEDDKDQKEKKLKINEQKEGELETKKEEQGRQLEENEQQMNAMSEKEEERMVDAVEKGELEIKQEDEEEERETKNDEEQKEQILEREGQVEVEFKEEREGDKGREMEEEYKEQKEGISDREPKELEMEELEEERELEKVEHNKEESSEEEEEGEDIYEEDELIEEYAAAVEEEIEAENKEKEKQETSVDDDGIYEADLEIILEKYPDNEINKTEST